MCQQRFFIVVKLNDRWRVIDHPLQWILQYRRNNRGRSDGSEDPRSWEGKRFCRTRTALLRDIRENCGAVDPAAVATLKTLPDRHLHLQGCSDHARRTHQIQEVGEIP
jgi:hypothetical protein